MSRAVSVQGEVTLLLEQARQGEANAVDRLTHLIYGELHKLAHAKMRKERPGHVLQTTALVNEVLVRLLEGRVLEHLPNRRCLFAAAARAMRNILVDHGRRRQVERRLGMEMSVPLDEILEHMENEGAPILELNQVLEELERVHPRQARVVEMRYFGGCSIKETADVLEVSVSTVENDFRIARAWLRVQLEKDL